MINLTFKKYLILTLTLLIILALNLLSWQAVFMGMIFGLLWLVFYGFILGEILFASRNFLFKTFYGLFFLISGISLGGALVYFFYKLSTAVIIIFIVLIPLVLGLTLLRKKRLPLSIGGQLKFLRSLLANKKSLLLVILFLILTLVNFWLIFRYQTEEAVRTPWQILPKEFFIIYFLSTLALFTLIFIPQEKQSSITNYQPSTARYQLVLIILHTLLTFSVVLILFPLGYGFDPFIHQATEKVINQVGLISPKPLYYLGQYSLVVFLAKLFQIDVVWPDKLLLPLLASFYLPVTIYWTIKSIFSGTARSLLAMSLIILILPFTSFIITTPQGLANFFLLLIILLGLGLTGNIKIPGLKLGHLIFLSLTTLAIHPLSGIPALIFILFLYLNRGGQKVTKTFLFIPAFMVSSIILPLVFTMHSLILGQLKIAFQSNLVSPFTTLSKSLSSLVPYWENRFHLFRDFIYLYGFNFDLVLLILILSGIIILFKQKNLKKFLPYLWMSLILFINFILLKTTLGFSSLIYYERGNFPHRILELSLYFLLPFFLMTIYALFKKLSSQSWLIKFSTLLFLSSLVTASLYLTYPRHDDYTASRAFNVSSSDLKAVHYIERRSSGDYLVLANQAVSAAALREFGFKKYYETAYGKQFYYPIPTGTPLYNFYLKMVYEKADQKIMAEAMDLVGVREAYFVVNSYWYAWPRVVEQAKVSAKEWLEIDKGKVFIFRYEKE